MRMRVHAAGQTQRHIIPRKMNNAEAYANAHGIQYEDARYVLQEFASELSRMHGRCIDIGCGPAIVSKELLLPKLPADATIVGADISETMLKSARAKCQNDERFSFLRLDIESPELPNELIECYDNAVSFYCLHWCENPRKALENMYQLLRPGGEALILFLSFNNGFDAYLKVSQDPRYQAYMKDVEKYRFFQKCANRRATVRRMLEETGFEIQHCSTRERSWIYKNIDILRAHILAVNPFVSRMPEDLIDEYLNDLTREIVGGMITFGKARDNRDNRTRESGFEYHILDRYEIIVAHFRKPKKVDVA